MAITSTSNPFATATISEEDNCNQGTWFPDEKTLFEQGVILHGWANWRSIQTNFVTTRKISQIKSHAQKLKTNHPEKVEQLKKEHEVNEKKIKKKRGKKKQNEAVVVECEFTYCFVCIY